MGVKITYSLHGHNTIVNCSVWGPKIQNLIYIFNLDERRISLVLERLSIFIEVQHIPEIVLMNF